MVKLTLYDMVNVTSVYKCNLPSSYIMIPIYTYFGAKESVSANILLIWDQIDTLWNGKCSINI